jgi:hypothetical protein
MPVPAASKVAVLAGIAASLVLAGCAGSAGRLPECEGTMVPINVTATVSVSRGPTRASPGSAGPAGRGERGGGNAQ